VITENRRRSLLKKQAEVRRAETRLENARQAFVEELVEASRYDKSSYQELGSIVDLSRQRIHQLVNSLTYYSEEKK